MSETILLGRGRQIIPIPRQKWEAHLAQVPEHGKTRFPFMTEVHQRVRYFVVRELPRVGQALPPEYIANTLKLPLEQTIAILDELEKNLFFLVRNASGAVSWAFPVTIEPTPHPITFSTGERLYAAWAEDAIATPFVQGQLRKENLSVTIQTTCAHCDRPLEITLDSRLNDRVTAGAEPLVFEPQVDWATFNEPNIIHAYWQNSLFFWSEEHAKEFWAERDHVDGTFITLEQAAYSMPITQGMLFAFG